MVEQDSESRIAECCRRHRAGPARAAGGRRSAVRRQHGSVGDGVVFGGRMRLSRRVGKTIATCSGHAESQIPVVCGMLMPRSRASAGPAAASSRVPGCTASRCSVRGTRSRASSAVRCSGGNRGSATGHSPTMPHDARPPEGGHHAGPIAPIEAAPAMTSVVDRPPAVGRATGLTATDRITTGGTSPARRRSRRWDAETPQATGTMSRSRGFPRAGSRGGRWRSRS